MAEVGGEFVHSFERRIPREHEARAPADKRVRPPFAAAHRRQLLWKRLQKTAFASTGNVEAHLQFTRTLRVRADLMKRVEPRVSVLREIVTTRRRANECLSGIALERLAKQGRCPGRPRVVAIRSHIAAHWRSALRPMPRADAGIIVAGELLLMIGRYALVGFDGAMSLDGQKKVSE